MGMRPMDIESVPGVSTIASQSPESGREFPRRAKQQGHVGVTERTDRIRATFFRKGREPFLQFTSTAGSSGRRRSGLLSRRQNSFARSLVFSVRCHNLNSPWGGPIKPERQEIAGAKRPWRRKFPDCWAGASSRFG